MAVTKKEIKGNGPHPGSGVCETTGGSASQAAGSRQDAHSSYMDELFGQFSRIAQAASDARLGGIRGLSFGENYRLCDKRATCCTCQDRSRLRCSDCRVRSSSSLS